MRVREDTDMRQLKDRQVGEICVDCFDDLCGTNLE